MSRVRAPSLVAMIGLHSLTGASDAAPQSTRVLAREHLSCLIVHSLALRTRSADELRDGGRLPDYAATNHQAPARMTYSSACRRYLGELRQLG
jgi:hypothetical protein